MRDPEISPYGTTTDQTTRTHLPRVDDPPQGPENGNPEADRSRKRKPFAWLSVLIIAAIVAVIGSGTFLTHQFQTYGALVPSINGGWYGPFFAKQSNAEQYSTDFTMYVVFARGQGDQLTATVRTCSTAKGGGPTQPSPVDFTWIGTMNGAQFTMPAVGGDTGSNLSWAGTYTTDQVHINFLVDGTTTSGSSYTNLQRGTYDDFLKSCKGLRTAEMRGHQRRWGMPDKMTIAPTELP